MTPGANQPWRLPFLGSFSLNNNGPTRVLARVFLLRWAKINANRKSHLAPARRRPQVLIDSGFYGSGRTLKTYGAAWIDFHFGAV